MNILVIGNGFDLAHGLPTKYVDFLRFCELIWKIQTNKWYQDENELQERLLKEEYNVHPYLKALLIENYSKGREKELVGLVYNNNWIEYFLQCDMHGKENWIDFESEISEVIQSIDKSMGTNNLYEVIISLENEFFNNKYTNNTTEYLTVKYVSQQKEIRKQSISYKEFRDRLLLDLNKLIRALEIYLTDYLESFAYTLISPDIRAISKKVIESENGCSRIQVSKVLCFNYTNTYQTIYLKEECLNDYIDYVHGKATISNTIESNNMVLGIDEYLPDDKKNRDTNFIAFKKFYQRIHKETGCKYKEWVSCIQEDASKFSGDNKLILKKLTSGTNNKYEHYKKYVHYLYIFGHSLDVTDGDILRDLILNDNVYTTIFIIIKT